MPVSGGSAATSNTTVAVTSVTANDTYYWLAAYSGEGSHKPVSACVESTKFASLSNGSQQSSG
jgi:hypothetical protein